MVATACTPFSLSSAMWMGGIHSRVNPDPQVTYTAAPPRTFPMRCIALFPHHPSTSVQSSNNYTVHTPEVRHAAEGFPRC